MTTKQNDVKKSERLQSLDVLRGFDMLWIVGGGSLIESIYASTKWGWLEPIENQFHHVPWAGFHFEDLIFPLFMFISGVAIPYAVTSKVEQGANKSDLFKKIVKRGLLLFVLGIIYNGALRNDLLRNGDLMSGLANIRIPSVLGQIGFGYLFAATIVLYTNTLKKRLFWLIGIMSGIAILQLAVPVPGYGAGVLDQVGGINAWLDRLIVPGRLHGKTFDPEGVLCIVSAIAVTLMGSFAGSILRDGTPASKAKSIKLAVIGIIIAAIALGLSPVYPIIKAAWTVPFNMLTSGIAFILLALFYFAIDVKGWTEGFNAKIILFFKVIGMNSITIYLGGSIFDFHDASQFFTGFLSGAFGPWIVVLGGIVIEWLVLYYLYQKKIFLRV